MPGFKAPLRLPRYHVPISPSRTSACPLFHCCPRATALSRLRKRPLTIGQVPSTGQLGKRLPYPNPLALRSWRCRVRDNKKQGNTHLPRHRPGYPLYLFLTDYPPAAVSRPPLLPNLSPCASGPLTRFVVGRVNSAALLCPSCPAWPTRQKPALHCLLR